MAVDIGKRNCKACIMNADASVAWEPKYDDKLTDLKYLFIRWLKNTANL